MVSDDINGVYSILQRDDGDRFDTTGKVGERDFGKRSSYKSMCGCCEADQDDQHDSDDEEAINKSFGGFATGHIAQLL